MKCVNEILKIGINVNKNIGQMRDVNLLEFFN